MRPQVLMIAACSLGLLGAPHGMTGQPVTVIAEGQVSCGEASIAQCRERALQEALRQAVEQGVGALIDSRTVMQDYVVESDLVRAASRGRVVRYEVLEQGLVGETGYRYRLRAEVAPVSEPEPALAPAPDPGRTVAPPVGLDGNLLRNADFTAALEDGWAVEEGSLTAYRSIDVLEGGLRLVYSGPGDGERQLTVWQRINTGYDPDLQLRARVLVDDREREGFPRFALALLDLEGRVLARHAWTADEFYRDENTVVTLLAQGRPQEIDAGLGALFGRVLTAEASSKATGMALSIEIAPPSGHRCRRCTIEVSGLAVQAP